MRLLFASAAALLVLALCLDARSPRSATAAAPGVRAGEEDDISIMGYLWIDSDPYDMTGLREMVRDGSPRCATACCSASWRLLRLCRERRALPESPDPTVAAVMRYYRERGYLVGGELSAP